MSTAAPAKPQKSGYDVPKPAGKCAVSGRDIVPGEKFVAAVRETDTGLERVDVSPNAGPTSTAPNSWASGTPRCRAEEKRKLFVDDEVLCNLFERLADAAEPGKINFRFMLALVLMRKRLIVYEDSRHKEGRDLWLVRMKGKDERLNLIDPSSTSRKWPR